MDHFGIGAAMLAAVGMYQQSARKTGRTTSLIESLKDGDRVIFADQRQADLFDLHVRERGIKVECRVVDPKRAGRAMEFGTAEGRTLFDHVWVEQLYIHRIQGAGQELDELQQALTGEGPAHREARWQARELQKWGPLAPFVPAPLRKKP